MTAAITLPKDFVSVKETARRTYRSTREITRLLCSGAIQGQKLGDEKSSTWIVFWPSAVKYYARRGIDFTGTSP